MAEERERLGKSRAEIAHACGNTPQAIGQFERGDSFPGGAVLTGYVRLGADVQYILTGVRSSNLSDVADGTGTYKIEKRMGALSRDEEVLVEKYRQLKPGDRTRAQAVFDALVAVAVKKDKAG